MPLVGIMYREKRHFIKIEGLHDLLRVFYGLYGDSFLLLYFLIAAVCVVVFFVVRQYWIPKIFERYPPFGFALISMGFLFIGGTVDLLHITLAKLFFNWGIAKHMILQLLAFIDELFDMNAALALLFASLSIGRLPGGVKIGPSGDRCPEDHLKVGP